MNGPDWVIIFELRSARESHISPLDLHQSEVQCLLNRRLRQHTFQDASQQLKAGHAFCNLRGHYSITISSFSTHRFSFRKDHLRDTLSYDLERHSSTR